MATSLPCSLPLLALSSLGFLFKHAMAWKRYGLKRYGSQSPETLLRVLLGFKRYGLKRSMG